MKPATSVAALASIDLTALEQKVLEVIDTAGATGCISDQILECYPNLSYSSITARFSSLEKKGEIYRAGDTRSGASGRQQQVMRAAKYKTTVPVTRPPKAPKKKRSGFMKGLMYAAALVAKSPDLAVAKSSLKRELLKAAGRTV